MRLTAFSGPVATLRSVRASVHVDKVTSNRATLSWASFHDTYTVDYTSAHFPRRSRRVVAHPNVTLKGLRPDTKYSIQIRGGTHSENVVLTTTCTAAPAAEKAPLTELSRLEIRVGRILEVAPHPDADSLYVERVDVGEDEPRTIVSGLVKFVPQDELLHRRVVVLCNLKPRAMRGVTSFGMLLCASNEDHSQVDPLLPHQDASVGELVTFDGHMPTPIEPGNRASKAFDRVAEHLRTDQEGVALYRDIPFRTSTGPCISPRKLVGSVS